MKPRWDFLASNTHKSTTSNQLPATNMQPAITAKSLIGTIDTMIMALKFAISAKDHTIFKNIADPILEILEDQGDENGHIAIPKELFDKVYWENMYTAWEYVITDDVDFIGMDDDLIPPRGTQPEYEDMCLFALEDELMPAKALLEAYLAETNAKTVTNMIMAKRLATYDDSVIGTIAELPNTIIDKIAVLASQ